MCYNYVHVLGSNQSAGLTWNDLIRVQPWLNNQSISGFIALNPAHICDNFANLLLDNTTVVDNLRANNQENNAFVQAVLRQWYNRTGSPVPCTWRDLIQCMKNAGLTPHTVQIIEQNILDEVQRPCELGWESMTYQCPS